jgi:hypothetical protein
MALFNPAGLFPDDVDIDKVNLRQAFNLLLAAVGDLPDTYAARELGEVIVTSQSGLGPIPAGAEGVAPIVRFAGRPVTDFTSEDIELGTTLNLNAFSHLGRNLLKHDETACTITVEPHPDRRSGVQHNFRCSIERYPNGGEVIVQSDLTNMHEQGHTKVAANGVAILKIDVLRGVWCLYGKTAL